MPVRRTTATLAALALGLAGCGHPAPRADAPAVPAIARAAPGAATATAAVPAPQPPDDGAAIPIALLLELAARANPDQQILEANRAAAAAIVRQSRAWANPGLELGAGRAKARTAGDDGERPATAIGGVGLSQRFELPAKRAARVEAAEAQLAVAERGAAIDRLDLELEIRSAALAVAGTAARAALARHGLELDAQVSGAVGRRMRAGESDRGDAARALADLENARLAADAAEAEAAAARAALRTWCGGALPESFTIIGMMPDAPPAIAIADLQRRALAAHPRLAMLDAQRAAGLAAIAAEERAWYPDLALGLSANREADTDDLGISLGFDLPLWDRNQGGVARAQAELSRLHAERRKALLAMQRQVAAAWSAYERERHRIAGLSGLVLPAAREALRLRLAAFEAGDATLLEVIDARRAELAAESALADARERAALARIELVRAVGADPSDPDQSATPPAIPTGAKP